ncbi:MAG: helix-turn-helix domain-containing protein [Rickettsiaceae bacterium]
MLEKKGKADIVDQLVGHRLRMRRMVLGMSQQDLGKAVGVSIQQIQKYEKATNRISSGKLFTLAKFLKVPITYFYTQNTISNQISESAFAEDHAEYDSDNGSEIVNEKEIISLIKAFSDIKNWQCRKKLIAFVKTLS